MPKKLFAVTNVKVSAEPDGWFPAESEIDVSKFTKEQLLALHEQGAIEVRVVDEEPIDEVKAAEEAMTPSAETEAPATEPEPEVSATQPEPSGEEPPVAPEE